MNGLTRKLSTLTAGLIFLLCASAPLEAASVARTVGKAAMRSAMARPTGTATQRAIVSGARNTGKPVDVLVSRKRYPEAAAHIDHAQRNGQPTILTLDRKNASNRRRESLRTVGDNGNRPGAKYDRDEYPPAITREGGSGSNVRFIREHDNRGAGKSFENQVRNIPNGSRVRVIVAD